MQWGEQGGEHTRRNRPLLDRAALRFQLASRIKLKSRISSLFPTRHCLRPPPLLCYSSAPPRCVIHQKFYLFPKFLKPAASSQGASGSDPYHGHKHTAKLCGRFVSHLFACPDVPPPLVPSSTTPTPRLHHLIAYALHRTHLHPSLLQRFKARLPAAKGSSGHRLFVSAFMRASKIIRDDMYFNKSWCIVGQGMFAFREINQMVREMCSYLD